MKKTSLFAKILSAAAVCSMLMFPCGCGDATDSGDSAPFVPAVSSADISGADVSSTDTFFSADETSPVYTICRGADAINMRDLEAYMSTIDPDSEVYEITRKDAAYLFAHYRLDVTIDSVDIRNLGNDSAVVTVSQTTLPVAEAAPVSASDVSASDVSASDVPAPLSGNDLTSGFTPCATVLTHTMTRIDGKWYITSTVVESYREISTQWDLLGEISSADPQSLVLSGNLQVTSSDSVSSADAA